MEIRRQKSEVGNQKTEDGRPIKMRLLGSLRELAMTTFIFSICFLSSAYANNLAVRNVSLAAGSDASHAEIKFDLSQDNSWRFSSDIYDAAWVFVKYSVDGADWQHATISSADTSAVTGTALTASIPTGGAGAFIYRTADAAVASSISTSGIKLQWTITYSAISPAAHKILLKVFALEMVHIPKGPFYLGSGGTETGSLTNGSWVSGATIPLQITSENALTVGTSVGNLWGTSSSGTNTIGAVGTLAAAFPKGYNAFYCMKYELTQGQYRDFINTLTRAQQGNRVASDISADVPGSNFVYVMSGTVAPTSPTVAPYRNGIRCPASGNDILDSGKPITFFCDLNNNNIPNEASDGEFIACNYLSWADLVAYADWACLRPMTELEYEKAARGTATPIANEYAWGTAGIASSAYTLSSSGQAGESILTNYSLTLGNAANLSTAGSLYGPVRAGIFAVSNSNRVTAGASFYGVLELTGNLWERIVSVGEETVGRLFTGVHGDGALENTTTGKIGDANVIAWPGAAATGAGYRGGDWNDDATSNARVSDRILAVSTNPNRGYRGGGRLVRTE